MAYTADIFNEWARRYASDPSVFDAEILDADGNPMSDYGQRCAIYFQKIGSDLDSAEMLQALRDE